MKITKERLNEYIVQFIKGHLIPNATKLETKFRLGFALGADLLSEFREELGVVADADFSSAGYRPGWRLPGRCGSRSSR